MSNQISSEHMHYLITPSDPLQREITEKIERGSRNRLIGEYKIRLNPGYMTTIAACYLEATIKTLVTLMRTNHGHGEINFLDLFTIKSSNRECDEGDKDGNINIRFIPGTICKTIMDSDYAPIITPDMWQGSILETVQATCGKILANKHKITGDTPYNWTKIAYVYFEFMYRVLKLLVVAAKDLGNTSVMINFLELFEIHAAISSEENPENPDLVHDEITVKIRPGFEAKLLIKDDGVTESDDTESDN